MEVRSWLEQRKIRKWSRSDLTRSNVIVDEAIKAAGGDMRAAIMGLIRGQHTYQAEIDRTVSAGYVRRGPRS